MIYFMFLTIYTRPHKLVALIFLSCLNKGHPSIHMKNSADQEGCYPQRLKAEVDNTLQDLQNSSYLSKAEFNNCLIIHSKYFPVLKSFAIRSLFFCSPKITVSSPGFLGQRFNNLQCAALLTSLIQFGEDSFQIW